MGSHNMQKSHVEKRETKSLVALNNNSHIGIWILILCKSRIVILHRLVTYYGVCYYFKERRVMHLPRWGVGALVTLGKHGGGLAVFRELNAALPPPSPVVNGGHPSLPPTPAVHGGAVGDAMRTSRGVTHSTGRLPWDSCRSVSYTHLTLPTTLEV